MQRYSNFLNRRSFSLSLHFQKIMIKESTKGHIALLVANIIFGFSAPFSKLLFNEFITHSQLLIIRIIGGVILFWIASLFIPKEQISKKDFLLILIAAFVGVIFNQGLYLAGLARTTPIHCGLLQTLGPIYTLTLATLFLKEPLSFKKVLGVVVGMIGASILIFSEFKTQVGTYQHSIWGDIMILLSGVSFALYLTLFMSIIKKYSAITLMKWMFLIAAIILTPFYVSDIKLFTTINFGSPDQLFRFLLYIGYVVILGTFVGYILMPYAQKRIRPTVVSMYVYLQPIIMTVVSIYWGLGTFGVDKVFATLLIFAGVYIVTRSKKRGTYLIK